MWRRTAFDLLIAIFCKLDDDPIRTYVWYNSPDRIITSNEQRIFFVGLAAKLECLYPCSHQMPPKSLFFDFNNLSSAKFWCQIPMEYWARRTLWELSLKVDNRASMKDLLTRELFCLLRNVCKIQRLIFLWADEAADIRDLSLIPTRKWCNLYCFSYCQTTTQTWVIRESAGFSPTIEGRASAHFILCKHLICPMPTEQQHRTSRFKQMSLWAFSIPPSPGCIFR